MSPRKILLVDDSALVRAVVAHALAAAGHEVASVEDPGKIDDAVAGGTPDLLLVDASYPGVTDDALVEVVSRHAARLPVVLFSDRPPCEVDALASRIGARGSVPKDGATLASRLAAFFSEAG
ncbi:MAG: response regulator [Labilithrix sp.]|nr:response regulator [Labilithrix sp.]MCW5812998.1 response regulator [Labilithrix sp.]